jgi:hypothetical protein
MNREMLRRIRRKPARCEPGRAEDELFSFVQSLRSSWVFPDIGFRGHGFIKAGFPAFPEVRMGIAPRSLPNEHLDNQKIVVR